MITATLQTKAGLVTIRIDDGADSTEAIITNIGSLSYDFDQTPEQVSIDRTQALYSSLNVSMHRDDIFGRNLWERLSQGEFESVPAFIDIDGNDGNKYEFVFRFERNNISFNERSSVIQIKLLPNVNKELTTGAVLDVLRDTNSISKGIYKFRRVYDDGSVDIPSQAQQVNCFGVRDFISATMSNVFGNTLPNYINSAKSNLPTTTERLYDNLPTNNQRGFVIADAPTFIPNTPIQTTFAQSEEVVKSTLGLGTISVFNNENEINIYKVVGFQTDFQSQVAVGDLISFIGRPSVFLNVFDVDPVNQILLCGGFVQLELPPPEVPIIDNSLYYIEKKLYPRDIPAIDTLRSLASTEGSIFGTGFSQNFYFNRLVDDTPVVTLDWNEVIDFKPSMFSLSLGNSLVAQRADNLRDTPSAFGSWGMTRNPQKSVSRSNFPNLVDTTAITQGNRGATKELKIESAPAYPFLNKAIKVFNQDINQDIYDGNSYLFRSEGDTLLTEGRDNSLELSLATAGLQSYFQALNNANGGIMVEFSVMGATSIKPWNSVQFDSRAPERYRDKQFRITAISYDLVNDIANIKAYQISSITTSVIADELIDTPIDFRFGAGLLPDRLSKAVGSDISRRFIDTTDFIFRTSQALSGTVTRVYFDRDADATGLRILKGWNVLLIDPISGSRQYFTVSKSSSPTENFFDVEPVELGRTYAGGSYLYVSQAQILSGLINGAYQQQLFAQSQAMGVLTASVSDDDLTTELQVVLYQNVVKGQDFTIQSSETGEIYTLTVGEDALASQTVLNIADEGGAGSLFEAPAGAFLIADGRFNRASINVDPGRVQIGVEAEREANGIGVIVLGIFADTTVTELRVSTKRLGLGIGETLDLLDGTKIIVVPRGGTGTQEFVVDGAQSLSDSVNTPIAVQSKLITEPVAFGSNVVQPAWNQTGEITVQAGRIDLLVTEVNGLDASLAGLTLEVGELEQETTTFRQTGRFAVTNQVVGFTGVLSTAVSGTTTSLEVGTALDFVLFIGDVLRLAPDTDEETDVVVATAISGGAGNHTIEIDSIALPPIGSGAQVVFVSGQRSALTILPTIPLELYTSQRVVIGTNVAILSANYTLSAGVDATIAYNTPITITRYVSPALPLDVFEPGVEISNKTSVIGARAVLQTDSSGNLAEVSLFSGPTGSDIKIKADFIVLEGQTTFLTDFYKTLSATSRVIASDTAPDPDGEDPPVPPLAVGDVWIDTAGNANLPYNWNGTGWIRGFTVVDAGNVTTGTLNANNVTIRASDSATTFVEINSSGITGKADDVVNFYLPNNTTDKPILKNFKLDRILIERRGPDDEPNQIVFSGSNFFGLGDVEEGFEMGAIGPFLTIFALENFSAEVGGIPEPARGFIQLDNELSVKPLRNFIEVGVEFPDGWTRGIDINNRLTVASDFDTAAQGKIYFRFNGSSVEDEERYFVLRGLPNSATGLPSGALWNDTGTIKIA
jgi:hypothetical protein